MPVREIPANMRKNGKFPLWVFWEDLPDVKTKNISCFCGLTAWICETVIVGEFFRSVVIKKRKKGERRRHRPKGYRLKYF